MENQLKNWEKLKNSLESQLKIHNPIFKLIRKKFPKNLTLEIDGFSKNSKDFESTRS